MKTEQVKNELVRLRGLGPQELRAEYERVFNWHGPYVGDVFALRRLSYYIQALYEGDLAPKHQSILTDMAKRDPRVTPGARQSRTASLPVRGVKYVREYKGKLYEVRSAGYGQFEMDGRFFPSLTACVREITGQHYSGRKWFKVKGGE